MKKLFGYIMCICIIFNMSGCKNKTSTGSDVLEKFDIEKATKTVESYIKASMKNDTSKIDSLYSKDFKKKTEEKKPNNVIITGYKLDEIIQSGDMGIIKAKITKVGTQSVYTQLETSEFRVINEKGSYKIKKMDNINEKECFIEGNQLRIRLKDKAKTLLVTSMAGIPKYYYAQEDKAKSNMLPVSLEQYGITTLTYEGTAQAISTKGKNSFIEIVHYEEAMMTQGTSDKQSGGGGETGGAGGGEINMTPEKPLAKEIVPIDVIQDGVVDNMVFSQDEKLLAVQYTKNNVGTSIKLYKHKTGEQVDFDFGKTYPMEKTDVTIEGFPKDGLVYIVKAKDKYKDDAGVKALIGKWQLDTKKFKVKMASE